MSKKKQMSQLKFSDDEIKDIIFILSTFSDKQKILFSFYVQFELTSSEQLVMILEWEESTINELLYASLEALKGTNQSKWKHAVLMYSELEIFAEVSPIVKLPRTKIKKRIAVRLQGFNVVQRVAIVGCVAVVIYSTVITGKALYTLGLVQIEHEKYSNISINSDPEQENLEFIETLYLPGYIPDGYQLSDQVGKPFESNLVEVIYKSNNNNIIFQQSIFDLLDGLDNEKINSSNININNHQGIYQEKEEIKTLVWIEKDYFYSLWCNSPNIKKLELIKIAESLMEVSYDKN